MNLTKAYIILKDKKPNAFNIGDKVTIKKDLSYKMYYDERNIGSMDIVPEMIELRGKEVTIEDIMIYDNKIMYFLKEDALCFQWTYDMFEHS